MRLALALGLCKARLISLCGSGGKTSLMLALAAEFAAAGERILVTTTTRVAIDEVPADRAITANRASEVLAQACSRPAQWLFATAGATRDPGKRAGLPAAEVDALAAAGFFSRVLVEADGSRRLPLKAPGPDEPVFPGATDAVVMVAGLSGLHRPLDDATVFRPEVWSRLTGLANGAELTPRSLAEVVLHEHGLARGCPAGAHRALFLNQADDRRRVASGREVLTQLRALPGRRPDATVVGRLLPEPELVTL